MRWSDGSACGFQVFALFGTGTLEEWVAAVVCRVVVSVGDFVIVNLGECHISDASLSGLAWDQLGASRPGHGRTYGYIVLSQPACR